MLVTMTHLRWYQERRMPPWLGKVQAPKRIGRQRQIEVAELIPKVTVHELINLQVTKVGYPHDPKAKKPASHEMGNLLNLLKLARSNGENMPSYIQHLVDVPYSTEPRRILAKRLLRHLRSAS